MFGEIKMFKGAFTAAHKL